MTSPRIERQGPRVYLVIGADRFELSDQDVYDLYWNSRNLREQLIVERMTPERRVEYEQAKEREIARLGVE